MFSNMFSNLSLILDISSQTPAVPVIVVLLLAAEFVMIHKNRLPWLLPLLSVAVFAISSLVYLARGIYPGYEVWIYSSGVLMLGNLMIWSLVGFFHRKERPAIQPLGGPGRCRVRTFNNLKEESECFL